MSHDPRYSPPDWAFTFHGHRCPFMPLGYRMGVLALDALGVAHEADHTLHVICELGGILVIIAGGWGVASRRPPRFRKST